MKTYVSALYMTFFERLCVVEIEKFKFEAREGVEENLLKL